MVFGRLGNMIWHQGLLDVSLLPSHMQVKMDQIGLFDERGT